MEQLIKSCESKLLIGCIDQEIGFFENNHHIGFVIKPLCEEASILYELEGFDKHQYVGYDIDQNGEILPHFYYLLEDYEVEVKLKKMESELGDRLLLFKPSFEYDKQMHKWNVVANIVATYPKDDHINHFNMIPEVKMNVQDFEYALATQASFKLNYDDRISEKIEMILCGKYIYRLKNPYQMMELFKQDEEHLGYYKLTSLDEIVKIDLKQYEDIEYYRYDQQVFVDDDLYCRMMKETNVESLDLLALNEMVKENERKNREVNFIKGLYEFTLNKGLQYEYKDLINFHTSIKTTPLTILAGMSGTGKTQLAYSYARMLSLSEVSNTLLFVPISPSYSEPSDILGYINAMNHTYVPSETGLVKFLNHAANHENQMHFVIFDEMNLSQVEHWFSSFISILEKDKEERILTLYDEDVVCSNKDVYPSKIALKDNLIFIGTMNLDETTKDFSDRLLDRTSMISLHKGKFTSFYENYQRQISKENDLDDFKQMFIDAKEFLGWKKTSTTHYMDTFNEHLDELLFLDELDTLIKRYIPNGGISYRVLRNIANYIANVAKDSEDVYLMYRKDVFDLVINQMIMPKIRGSESQIGLLLGYVEEQSQKVIQSDLLELLDKYTHISLFIEVRKNIYRKAKDLMIHGYTN